MPPTGRPVMIRPNPPGLRPIRAMLPKGTDRSSVDESARPFTSGYAYVARLIGACQSASSGVGCGARRRTRCCVCGRAERSAASAAVDELIAVGLPCLTSICGNGPR